MTQHGRETPFLYISPILEIRLTRLSGKEARERVCMEEWTTLLSITFTLSSNTFVTC